MPKRRKKTALNKSPKNNQKLQIKKRIKILNLSLKEVIRLEFAKTAWLAPRVRDHHKITGRNTRDRPTVIVKTKNSGFVPFFGKFLSKRNRANFQVLMTF
jgi:hypothetical protein